MANKKVYHYAFGRRGCPHTPAIDANLPVPLYHQLKEQVRRDIVSGLLLPGDRLPTERELEQRYGVSRITVRQALRDLMVEGLLVRQRGRGTFVAHPKIHKALKSAASFTRDMESRGLTAGARVLAFSEVPATESIAEGLQLPVGTPLVYLERLRLADREPMALQWCYLQSSRFPGLLAVKLGSKSLYEFLAASYGVSIMAGTRTIEGVVASRRQAELLQVRVGAPLLRLGGVNLDQHGKPVEFGATLYRADRYKFYVDF